MKGKKIYILFVLLGMAALIVCMVVGALYRIDWIILLGFGICIADWLAVGIVYGVKFIRELNAELKVNAQEEHTAEREQELIDKINSATDREESLKAQAEYYSDGAETSGELIATAFGFSKEGKEAFKKTPASEKAKPILLFIWLGLALLTFFVGISLASVQIQPAGFIVMGAGGGSFFLTVIGFLIYSIVERRIYFSGVSKTKKSKPQLHVKATRTRTGVVKRCEIHSQHKAGNRTPNISGTLYQIWVWTSSDAPLVRIVCSRRYQKYEKVTFTESRGLYKKRKIIE